MHLLRIDIVSFVLFRSVTVLVGVHLCNAYIIHVCTCFQCVLFVNMTNMDCSEEEDFALLLLAEEAAIPKKNMRTNTQTIKHKQTNTQMLLIL